MMSTKDVTKRAADKLVAAFNRADEIGGEIRDFLQDKVAHDPRYVSARRKVASLLGKSFVSKPETVAKAQAAEAKRAATAATAATTAKATTVGFGDPALKAQIFGKKSCPWTGRAITLLERHKLDYDYLDLEEPEHEAKLDKLVVETKQHTVPFIYLRGQFIGGFNALAEVERLGQLEYAMMTADERANVPAHARFEIVSRPNTDEEVPAEHVRPGE